MNINKFHRLDVGLLGETEIKAFEDIVALAVSHLQVSSIEKLSGPPLDSQAGIKGADLINVKNMLQKFADRFGWDQVELEPAAKPAEEDPDDIPDEISELANMLRKAGANVRVTKVRL